MRSFLMALAAVFMVCLVGQWLLPWWATGGLAMLTALWIKIKPGLSFWAGFLAVALLWGGYAAWLSWANEGILAARMGALFGLSGGLLLLVTALIGGLLGGLGALTGSLARRWLGA